jgi:hypothetical protein
MTSLATDGDWNGTWIKKKESPMQGEEKQQSALILMLKIQTHDDDVSEAALALSYL